jgi:hypothetical protein
MPLGVDEEPEHLDQGDIRSRCQNAAHSHVRRSVLQSLVGNQQESNYSGDPTEGQEEP